MTLYELSKCRQPANVVPVPIAEVVVHTDIACDLAGLRLQHIGTRKHSLNCSEQFINVVRTHGFMVAWHCWSGVMTLYSQVSCPYACATTLTYDLGVYGSHVSMVALCLAGAEPAPEQDETEADIEDDGTHTIAAFLDKRLEHEFRNEELASQSRTDLNETLSKEKVSTICHMWTINFQVTL